MDEIMKLLLLQGFTKVLLTVLLDTSWFFMEPSGNSEEVIHLHHLRAPHESVEIHRLVRKEGRNVPDGETDGSYVEPSELLTVLRGSTLHVFISQQSDGWMFVEE